MNFKLFTFLITHINTILILEELPLLFKKIKDNNCQQQEIDNGINSYLKYSYSSLNSDKSDICSSTSISNIKHTKTILNPLYIQTPISIQTTPISIQQNNIVPIKTFNPVLETHIASKPLTNFQKTGKASFYFRIGSDKPGCPSVQTFNDGNAYGPCNNGNGIKYDGNGESKYWVAIKNADLYCGKSITINYKSNSIKLKVMDKCPSCSDNDLDMSLDALIELTGSIEAACSINTTPPIVNWKFD
jgi:hypothetical protein